MPGPQALAERRRTQVEAAYQAGLIKEVTYERVSSGADRANWAIDTLDGKLRHFTSRELGVYLRGLIDGPGVTPEQRAAVEAALALDDDDTE